MRVKKKNELLTEVELEFMTPLWDLGERRQTPRLHTDTEQRQLSVTIAEGPVCEVV